MLGAKHASETMSKYRLRPVVLDHRKGIVVHYGSITDLDAQDVRAARIEVDRLPLGNGANCLQILDTQDAVVTHRMLNPENGDDEWKDASGDRGAAGDGDGY
jgi:hypothetical protein